MTTFTRVTVVGRALRADIVVPDDELLGTLVPSLMTMLEEPAGSAARPLTLVRATGQQLDLQQSLRDQNIPDGESLRLVRVDAAPPPPEVTDVTDVLAETHDARAGRWGTTPKHLITAVGLGVLGTLASAATASLIEDATTSALTLAGGVLLLAVLAVPAGLVGGLWYARALTAVGLGAVPAVGVLGAVALGWVPATSGFAAVATSLALVVGWVALGLGLGVGTSSASIRHSAAAGVGLGILPLALIGAGISVTSTAAVTALVAVVAVGLVPWFALASSGLTGLDDQIIEGRGRRRPEVLSTADVAYRSLTGMTVAIAVPLTGATLLLLSSGNAWASGLAAAVTVVTALRTRAFPLAVPVAALWVAAALPVIAAILTLVMQDPVVGLLIALGTAAALVVAAAAAPAPHRRARLRRVGNVIELLAVLALLPVALGVFGVYADLLGAF